MYLAWVKGLRGPEPQKCAEQFPRLSGAWGKHNIIAEIPIPASDEHKSLDELAVLYPCPKDADLLSYRLERIACRMRFRIDAIREQQGEVVGVSMGFAEEIALACRDASKWIAPTAPSEEQPKIDRSLAQ